jgi:phosphoglycolate phosphatase
MTGVLGVVFDKDGTLFDFLATWGGWAARFLDELAAGDRAQAARLADAIGFRPERGDFAPGSPVIAGTPDDIAEGLLPLLPGMDRAALLARINRAAERLEPAPAAPLVPLLSALRAAGLRLGVATNDAEAPALAQLARAGIADFFDFVSGCDSGWGAKPGPGMLAAFAAATGLAPAAVVMVGDTPHDLLAARAAGMRPVAVLTGLAHPADLEPLAEAVLPHVGHLPGWLGIGCV